MPRRLRAADVITADEFNQILAGLQEIGQRFSNGSPGSSRRSGSGGRPSFCREKLVELIGETGKKLHSGRSRNEQIATDLRLFVRESIDQLLLSIDQLLSALLQRAEQSQTRSCPPIPICSAPSLFWWRTGCWLSLKCFGEMRNACATAAGG